MAKRARDTGGSVNLFPFLSILICIIGCLTLIIVVMNLIAMSKGEGRTSEEVERAREFVVIEKEKEEKQKEQDKLRQLIENLIQQNKDVITARDKLVTLKKMLENQEDIDKGREELIAKFNLLQTTNKKLVEDEKFLQEEIKKKEAEIAKRGTPPQPAALRVRPSGSSACFRPARRRAWSGARRGRISSAMHCFSSRALCRALSPTPTSPPTRSSTFASSRGVWLSPMSR